MIPKIIHISWKNKDILKSDSVFIQNGIKKLVELNPDWDVQISDDCDVDKYLKDNLSIFDYSLLKRKHVVEKLDVWRLIKLYQVGGLYIDIDRYCNISFNEILTDKIKCVLPTCLDHDFSHDFMMSCKSNPVFGYACKLNLERRNQGSTNIYYLGAQTYMHSITKNLLGEEIDTNPGKEVFDNMRNLMNKTDFILTYTENPPIDTIIFRNSNITKDQHEMEKREFYASQNIKHWSQQW
jgi:hypothetical protein